MTRTRCKSCAVLLIDAANVVGSRPSGWWRDRPKAAAQFVERVRNTSDKSRLPQPVVIVLEGQARHGAEDGDSNGVVSSTRPAKEMTHLLPLPPPRPKLWSSYPRTERLASAVALSAPKSSAQPGCGTVSAEVVVP